jgi:hypothetical protein
MSILPDELPVRAIFLLTKSRHYWFELDSICTPTPPSGQRCATTRAPGGSLHLAVPYPAIAGQASAVAGGVTQM